MADKNSDGGVILFEVAEKVSETTRFENFHHVLEFCGGSLKTRVLRVLKLCQPPRKTRGWR